MGWASTRWALQTVPREALAWDEGSALWGSVLRLGEVPATVMGPRPPRWRPHLDRVRARQDQCQGAAGRGCPPEIWGQCGCHPHEPEGSSRAFPVRARMLGMEEPGEGCVWASPLQAGGFSGPACRMFLEGADETEEEAEASVGALWRMRWSTQTCLLSQLLFSSGSRSSLVAAIVGF